MNHRYYLLLARRPSLALVSDSSGIASYRVNSLAKNCKANRVARSYYAGKQCPVPQVSAWLCHRRYLHRTTMPQEWATSAFVGVGLPREAPGSDHRCAHEPLR